MPSPESSATVPVNVNGRPRKKKACQRCRHRKQRCDFEQPCQNCLAAGQDCAPVIQEPHQSYPAGYVSSLEDHVAALERQLNEQLPGTSPNHLLSRTGDQFVNQQVGESSTVMGLNGQNAYYFDHQSGQSPEAERSWQWQLPHTPTIMPGAIAIPPGNGRPNDHSSPPDYVAHSIASTSHIATSFPSQRLAISKSDGPEDVPTATAASFFRTYFQFIHPQYPFLSIKDCGEWYTEWKSASPSTPISGWPAYFVKMIFAIGSLIQSKSDTAPRFQHQDLKSQAQSEDSIIRSTNSTPLIRLQAMLLSAMHALHSESTARIAHISGAIIRFASFHGFHRLVDMPDELSQLKTRAWSCAYTLDRGISATLDIPVSLPDMYISSTLYTERPEEQYPMPWLSDLPPDTPCIMPTLETFAHTCKIRLIQSYIMHTMQSISLEGGATPEWLESMELQIDNWSNEIYSYSLMNNEGYQSPHWLGLISHLSRLLLCRPSMSNINSHVSDVALKAGCDACTTFRALQKRRQIAQPWLVVLTQFQAGVTVLYIIYARGITVPKEADIAIRDCTSVLAILADRWQNAEHYRDCFEVLARAVAGRSRQTCLDAESRDELVGLTERVNEAGVNRHVTTMLLEMATNSGDGMDF
ncbi:hypothetical protein VTL71DRAFT_14124 [Oculimacula yallundae]|uniref:Zn(2)-C6 fungal-type domain-containing protein n=1 Tax=Oculimacula yallundae TaxID=86028 RepID=A0ABR4CI95_9HELO